MPLTPQQRKYAELLDEVFFGYARDRIRILRERGFKLAHYTTAENALSILKSRTLWMRETRCMNDFSEVTGGYQLLLSYMRTEAKRNRFLAALDSCYEGAGVDVLSRFDNGWEHIQTSTFITCFSEHVEPSEDRRGRLSMWRAFGSRNGVAMILKWPDPYSALPLRVWGSPVAYLEEAELWTELDKAIERIETASSQLTTFLDRDALVFAAYRMLVMATVSLKQPIFKEEHEWRFVHLPFEDSGFPFVVRSTETIQGILQDETRKQPSARRQWHFDT
jgi:hypothetical protein